MNARMPKRAKEAESTANKDIPTTPATPSTTLTPPKTLPKAGALNIANPRNPERTREVELLVDTGAMYSMVPSKILRELGVEPEGTRTFTLASGEKLQRKVGGALYKLDGVSGYATVIFGEERDKPLLGVTALEEMGLEVDPVAKNLKPTELYLL